MSSPGCGASAAPAAAEVGGMSMHAPVSAAGVVASEAAGCREQGGVEWGCNHGRPQQGMAGHSGGEAHCFPQVPHKGQALGALGCCLHMPVTLSRSAPTCMRGGVLKADTSQAQSPGLPCAASAGSSTSRVPTPMSASESPSSSVSCTPPLRHTAGSEQEQKFSAKREDREHWGPVATAGSTQVE